LAPEFDLQLIPKQPAVADNAMFGRVGTSQIGRLNRAGDRGQYWRNRRHPASPHECTQAWRIRAQERRSQANDIEQDRRVAATLLKTEEQLRDLLETAEAAQIVQLLEAFSPARSPGPDWTRSFDPLVERLWTWCDGAVLAAAEADLRARGPAWLAVANALTPERGEEIRASLQARSGGARFPRFTLA
jgi:hypothetical protein